MCGERRSRAVCARPAYGTHVDEKLPERLPTGPCIQIPKSIVHGACCNMNNALLWADPNKSKCNFSVYLYDTRKCKYKKSRNKSVPPKLRVSDEVIPSFAHVGEQRLDLLVHDSTSDRLDRLTNLKMQNQQ